MVAWCWTRRHLVLLYAIAIGGVGLGWILRRTHLATGWWWTILHDHTLDFVAVPFTTVTLLELSRPFVERRQGSDTTLPARYRLGAAVVSLAFWLVIEASQIRGGILPYSAASHSTTERLLNCLGAMLGRVFDWRDVACEVAAFALTIWCLMRAAAISKWLLRKER